MYWKLVVAPPGTTGSHHSILVNTLKICATYLLQCNWDYYVSFAIFSNHVMKTIDTMRAHEHGFTTTLEHWEEGKGREG